MAPESNDMPIDSRRGLYEAVFQRRDIREFLPDPIPDEVLARVLVAAHHAGSVGFTQPWNFVIVKDLNRRRQSKGSLRKSAKSMQLSSMTIGALSSFRSSSRAFWKRPST